MAARVAPTRADRKRLVALLLIFVEIEVIEVLFLFGAHLGIVVDRRLAALHVGVAREDVVVQGGDLGVADLPEARGVDLYSEGGNSKQDGR